MKDKRKDMTNQQLVDSITYEYTEGKIIYSTDGKTATTGICLSRFVYKGLTGDVFFMACAMPQNLVDEMNKYAARIGPECVVDGRTMRSIDIDDDTFRVYMSICFLRNSTELKSFVKTMNELISRGMDFVTSFLVAQNHSDTAHQFLSFLSGNSYSLRHHVAGQILSGRLKHGSFKSVGLIQSMYITGLESMKKHDALLTTEQLFNPKFMKSIRNAESAQQAAELTKKGK